MYEGFPKCIATLVFTLFLIFINNVFSIIANPKEIHHKNK